MNVIKLRPDRDDMIKGALEAHMSRSERLYLNIYRRGRGRGWKHP
jgi:hypothetical protein